jgi:beta-lactam-binding protein with PASTA domain
MTVIVVRKGLEAIEIKSYNGRTTDQTVETIRELERYYNCRRSNICIDSD